MRRFADLPVRQKLVLIVVLASGGALLAANAGVVLADLAWFRRELLLDLRSLAGILAENSTAALAFDDAAAAAETLSALRARPDLAAAAVYRAGGGLLARYVRAGERRVLPGRPPPDGARFTTERLVLVRPVQLRRERIGTLYLEADLAPMYARLRAQAGTVTAVLLGSMALSILLALRLQRVVSQPILELAATAEAVSRQRDYALRAVPRARDEVGQLVVAFNQMLAQIEDRDRELQRARDELEQRVQQRTAELRQELAERRRAERELAERNAQLDASNRELDDFAYIASHDLKEPLRGIHNFAVFLLEDHGERLGGDGRAKLETLVRLSRRMEALIDSLLHYSRVGRVDLARERVDLNAVLAQALDSLSVQLAAQGVEVRVPRPLPAARCDRVQAGEVFQNLVANAIKYNDKPAGRWVEIGFREAAGGPPVFYVRDNGMGIQGKHFEAIFRIFKRLHGRERFGGGTGAGLTIVKKIVERHGGRVWLESAPGEGTTFYFTLEGERSA